MDEVLPKPTNVEIVKVLLDEIIQHEDDEEFVEIG